MKADYAMSEFARRVRDGDPPSIKEFEDVLREAGIPKAMAVQIASVGYAKAIRSESEGNEANAAAAFLQARLVSGIAHLRGYELADPRVRTAITTSSSEALPARSPRPLIVHSTWRAPASTAANELDTANPRSLWQ